MSQEPSLTGQKRFLLIVALVLLPIVAYTWFLWHAPSEQPYHRTRLPPSTIPSHGVMALAFSPDGLTLATGSDDGALCLWNVQEGTPRWHHTEQKGVSAVAFSSEGRLLASVNGPSISLWSLPSLRLQKTFTAPLPLVSSVAFSPDGGRVAVGCATGDIYKGDGALAVWNVKTGQKTLLLGRTAFVGSVAFSPDGRFLAATCGQNLAEPPGFKPVNIVRVWDVTNAKLSWEVRGSHPLADVAFSPDGRLVCAGNSTPQAFDAHTGKYILDLQTWPGSATHIALSPDGKVLAGSGSGSSIAFWNLTNGRWIDAGHTLNHLEVNALAFSKDGRRLASANGQTKVYLWDTTQLSARRALSHPQLLTHVQRMLTIDTFKAR